VPFIAKSRAGIVTRASVQGAPDLVIEVVSESTRNIDRTTKLKLHGRFGVGEDWIIDPEACSAERYRLQSGGLEFVQKPLF